jgi:LacI family transcriptional regulator
MKVNRPHKSDLRIAFVVPDIGRQTRQILVGIHRYALANTHWHLRLALGDSHNIIPVLKKAGIDGAFVSFRAEHVNHELLAMGLSCIALNCLKIPRNVPYVTTDSVAAGRAAAEHFIERGFHSFAYYSPSDIFWSERRREGFCGRLSEAGYSASVYRIKGLKGPMNWLKSLPKPVGLMACDDGVGYDLIEAAGEAGIHIPEDVAVMGVDNDDILCNSVRPPLSSVDTNFEQAGYEAAELLNAIMTGQEAMPGHPILARVSRVVVRQSSDILAINDPHIAAAVHFIRTHFNSPIQVVDVVNATSLSRRVLEKKFRAVLKRSILDEIMRRRVEHIVDLLLKSNMSIDQIVASSTFDSASHMIRVFRKHMGMPPRAFRKTHGIV